MRVAKVFAVKGIDRRPPTWQYKGYTGSCNPGAPDAMGRVRVIYDDDDSKEDEVPQLLDMMALAARKLESGVAPRTGDMARVDVVEPIATRLLDQDISIPVRHAATEAATQGRP